MQIQKKAVLLILSTLFLLALIPEVFALFEYLYLGGAIDPLELYLQWQGWFDFTLITALMIIFLSIFLPIALRIQEDEEQKHSMQKLAVILGLIIGLGVSYFGRQYFPQGLILGLGPLWVFFFMFVLVFMLYRTAKGEGEGKLGIGVAIFLLLATFLLAGIIFPGIYGPIAGFLFNNALISAIIIFLGIIGLIALLLWILGMLGGPFKWLRGKWGNSSPGGGGSGGNGRGKTPEEVRPTVIKKPKIRDVKIETLPPGPYEPGKEVVLRALITEVGGIPFTSRSAGGTFVCTWRVNNLVLEDHNQEVIWRVPQALINTPEQELRIQVDVIDKDDPRRKGRGSTIVKVRGGIPEIMILEPVDTSRGQHSREVQEGETLKFRYIFNPQKPAPQGVANAAWFFIQGHLTEIDKKIIKKATLIAEGNDFTAVAGQNPLNLNPEVPYTIICTAVDKNGNPYIMPVINKLLESHFTLIVKRGKVTTPAPTPKPTPGKEPKFFVKVTKVADKLISNSLILRTDKNSSFDAGLKERYNFTPEIEDGNIDDYEISMAINSNDFFEPIEKGPAYLLELQNPGTKKVTCVFQKKGSSKSTIIPGTTRSIQITINVGKVTTPAPTPKPTPGKEPKFFVNVEKLGNKPLQILRTETNSSFDADLKEKYTFTSEVENDNIDNYEINMVIDSNDFFKKIAGRPDYFLELKSPGTKKVTCVFQKKGSSKSTIIPGTTRSIQIIINVGKSGTPPPPPGTEELELKITKVNNISVRTGMVVPLALDENITIEVDSQDPENRIEEYLWYVEKGGQREPLARLKNKRAILKFSGAKYFPEEYKIFVAAGSKGNILNDSKGNPIFDYFIARFIAFVVDHAFKSDIDEIKGTVGIQANILSKIAEELKKKEPNVKELIGDFNDVELDLQKQLVKLNSKALDLERKGKINEFMAKAVRDWALRVAQLTREGKEVLILTIEFINKNVDAGRISNAVKVLEGGLLGKPDPKMKFKGGYFTRRKATVNEVD